MRRNSRQNHRSNGSPRRKAVDVAVTKVFARLQEDFVVVGRERVSSWHAWLLIGVATGITVGVLSVANRSGEFEAGEAKTVPEVEFSDNFDRPNSIVPGNGWVEIKGGFHIENGQLRNDRQDAQGRKIRDYSIAVQPTLTGSTQHAAASFALTNRDARPRFGVILRYQDPQNYYLFYREAGDTNTLRISRVVAGVETVLASASIFRPPSNTLFRLEGKASGNILSLLLDGKVRLLASDTKSELFDLPTFTTGTVGILLGAQKDIAHRMDDFKATVIQPAPQPSIIVVSPNGGETWQIGTKQTIKWATSLQLSCVSCVAPPQGCRYEGASCETCGALVCESVIGQAPFRPEPLPGGGGGGGGGPNTVDIFLASWAPPCDSKINPCPTPPTFLTFVEKDTPNDGSFEWKVGDNNVGAVVPDGQYVIVVSLFDGSAKDQSDAPFSIVAAPLYTTEPSATLVRGQSYDFVGKVTSVLPNAKVYFFLRRPDGTLKYSDQPDQDILQKAPSQFTDANGNYNVSARQTLTIEGQNGIWTSWVTVGGLESNKVFHNVVSDKPSITVLSPNGGEVWQIGSLQTVKWTPISGYNYVLADLVRGVNNTFVKSISVGNSMLTGQFTWQIPPDIANGSDYKIYMNASNAVGIYGTVSDTSDAPFSIRR